MKYSKGIVGFVVAVSLACGGGGGLDGTYTGPYTDSNGACLNGNVTIDLETKDDGSGLHGTLTFTDGASANSVYLVEGQLTDEGVNVRQVGLESAAAKEGTRWCHGMYTLTRSAGGLVGSYAAEDCGCNGTVALTEI